MKKVILICAATLSGFAIGVGCSGGAKMGLGEKATATVGATGGTVENSAGLTIDIPAGAVDGNVTVTATPQASAPASMDVTNVSNAVLLEPEGQQFKEPVAVTIPFDALPSGANLSDLVVYTSPRDGSEITELGGQSVDATHIRAFTTHFSLFWIGLPKKPITIAFCNAPVACGTATANGGSGGGGGSSGSPDAGDGSATCTCRSTVSPNEYVVSCNPATGACTCLKNGVAGLTVTNNTCNGSTGIDVFRKCGFPCQAAPIPVRDGGNSTGTGGSGGSSGGKDAGGGPTGCAPTCTANGSTGGPTTCQCSGTNPNGQSQQVICNGTSCYCSVNGIKTKDLANPPACSNLNAAYNDLCGFSCVGGGTGGGNGGTGGGSGAGGGSGGTCSLACGGSASADGGQNCDCQAPSASGQSQQVKCDATGCFCLVNGAKTKDLVPAPACGNLSAAWTDRCNFTCGGPSGGGGGGGSTGTGGGGGSTGGADAGTGTGGADGGGPTCNPPACSASSSTDCQCNGSVGAEAYQLVCAGGFCSCKMNGNKLKDVTTTCGSGLPQAYSSLCGFPSCGSTGSGDAGSSSGGDAGSSGGADAGTGTGSSDGGACTYQGSGTQSQCTFTSGSCGGHSYTLYCTAASCECWRDGAVVKTATPSTAPCSGPAGTTAAVSACGFP